MSGLTEFLLARIAEDEAAARAAMAGFPTGEWTDDGGIYAGHPTHEVVDWVYEDARPHIARWDPARVLAECEAKRRIVEVHALVPATDIWGEQTGGLGCAVCDERADLTCGGYEIESSGGCATLRLLALPYADHPDYDEQWRP